MRNRGGGVVLNISSATGPLSTSAYGVSKLAVRGLTVAFASELSGDLIRVGHALSPPAEASLVTRGNPQCPRQLPAFHLTALSGLALPAGYADRDHPQLFDGDPPDLLQRLGGLGVFDRLGDGDHRVHEQGRKHIEVLGAPFV